jgi:hypothetical protein
MKPWKTRDGEYLLKKGLHFKPFLREGIVLHIIGFSGFQGCREEKLIQKQSIPCGILEGW